MMGGGGSGGDSGSVVVATQLGSTGTLLRGIPTPHPQQMVGPPPAGLPSFPQIMGESCAQHWQGRSEFA